MKRADTCEVKRCRQPSNLIFYGKEVCNKHWLMDCDECSSFNLKKHFGVVEK